VATIDTVGIVEDVQHAVLDAIKCQSIGVDAVEHAIFPCASCTMAERAAAGIGLKLIATTTMCHDTQDY
jgi:hypothetical protein